MNLQQLLQGVLPENWMTQVGVLPSFAIDNEFESKERELQTALSQAETEEKRTKIILQRQEMADKKQQWLQYSQG